MRDYGFIATIILASLLFGCVLPKSDGTALVSRCGHTHETTAEPYVEHQLTGPPPLVQLRSQYPLLAERYCVSGWVMISYNLADSGDLYDLRVIDSEPKYLFDESALEALQKWKYVSSDHPARRAQVRGCALFLFHFSREHPASREPPAFPESTCSPGLPAPPRAT